MDINIPPTTNMCRTYIAVHIPLRTIQAVQRRRELQKTPPADAGNFTYGALYPNRFLAALALAVAAAYLVLGSYAFGHFEADRELAERAVFRHRRQRFLSEHPGIADADLEDLIGQVMRLQRHGVSALHAATAADSPWSFGQSVYFAATVLTTICYGHITPLSWGGKVFCMLYAIIGIPWTVLLISAVGDRLQWPIRWLKTKLSGMEIVRNLYVLKMVQHFAPWLMRLSGLIVDTAIHVTGISLTMH